MRGRVGRPRRRPKRLLADRGYDHDKYRRELRQRRITPEIARLKRLLVRYDRRHEIHEAFLAIGCCLVCFRRLQNSL